MTKVPGAVKMAVQIKANELIETVLKPKHVKPPAKDERFNYIADIYTKWYRHYFYFCARYRVPGPNAVSPLFEEKFGRLEYVGHDRFNLSYMRHTEEWWEFGTGLSLDQCLAHLKDDPLFQP